MKPSTIALFLGIVGLTCAMLAFIGKQNEAINRVEAAIQAAPGRTEPTRTTYMRVWTDPKTGCDYLLSWNQDAIEPRRLADGTQFCDISDRKE